MCGDKNGSPRRIAWEKIFGNFAAPRASKELLIVQGDQHAMDERFPGGVARVFHSDGEPIPAATKSADD
jgi:hypothetical protein